MRIERNNGVPSPRDLRPIDPFESTTSVESDAPKEEELGEGDPGSPKTVADAQEEKQEEAEAKPSILDNK